MLDHKLLRLLRTGDVAAATALLNGPMTDVYDEHRAAVDHIVTKTVSDAAAGEAAARATSAQRQERLTQLLVGTLLALVLVYVAIG